MRPVGPEPLGTWPLVQPGICEFAQRGFCNATDKELTFEGCCGETARALPEARPAEAASLASLAQ